MAVNLEIGVESARAERFLAALAGQLPFATSLAINRTAKDVQTEETKGIFQRFTIRRQPFARRATKISPFATKRSLEARVKIEPPGGRSRADIFAKFERRTRKLPRDGRFLAVPIEARRGRTGVISRSQRPRSFQFRQVDGRILGRRRTFLIRTGRAPGIYQRVGRGPNSRIRLLYAFKRSIPIDDRLQFVETARRVVGQRFAPNFSDALAQALRTARR